VHARLPGQGLGGDGLSPGLKALQGLYKGLLGLPRRFRLTASRLVIRLRRVASKWLSSSSPSRGSTRTRAAGDSQLRSGLPVPDTGQTRVPR
jgi:hypothetical protein